MPRTKKTPSANLEVVGDPDALSPLEEAFALDYCKHGNGTRAVIAAGYSAAGASVTATKLLRRPRVQKRIAELGGSMLSNRERAAVNRETLQAVSVLKATGSTASVDWVVGELVKNVMIGRKLKQIGASNAALVKIGEHIGMWKDARKGDTDGRTEEQLTADFRAIVAEARRLGEAEAGPEAGVPATSEETIIEAEG